MRQPRNGRLLCEPIVLVLWYVGRLKHRAGFEIRVRQRLHKNSTTRQALRHMCCVLHTTNMKQFSATYERKVEDQHAM